MIDTVNFLLNALSPSSENPLWFRVALIIMAMLTLSIGLVPPIAVAVENLMKARRRLKNTDDWASKDSFLRTSDPVLWRRNLVFNKLRIDYINSDRLGMRLSRKETPFWSLAVIAFVALIFLLGSNLISRYAATLSPAQQSGDALQSGGAVESLLHYQYVFLSFVLSCAFLLTDCVIFYHSRVVFETEGARRVKVLSQYLRDLGFKVSVSRVAARYWYHFTIEHPPALGFVKYEEHPFVSLRLRHCNDDYVLMRVEHIEAISADRRVKRPTCGKGLPTWLAGLWFWLGIKDNWNEQDIKFACAALSDLFSAENMEKYLHRHESHLKHGGSSELGIVDSEERSSQDGTT